MVNYWATRYLETVAKYESTTNPRARDAYRQLADHYRAMCRICGRTSDKDYMLAA